MYPSHPGLPDAPQRQRLTVCGVVQGVGFRPFVYTTATALGLTGFVGNDSCGVFIELQGSAAALERFQQMLHTAPPPMAHIEAVHTRALPPIAESSFTIVASAARHAAHTLIAPDLCLCAECLRELFDVTDRRYRYPFINCTNCGPRFTIIRDIPYDRPLTTMAPFSLCPTCRREYEDPRNRRFHAQPNACPDCGPQVFFERPGQQPRAGDEAFLAAQNALVAGQIVAVKGLGGFHLACDATNARAVQRLRDRKNRPAKPLAVMAADMATVRQFAHVTPAEEAALTSRERPIVLLRKRAGGPVAEQVAPGNAHVGAMLPYTPLHYLLFAPPVGTSPTPALPTVLVMTSGNPAGEPIISDNDDARVRLSPLADGLLLHNRAIQMPCDDSVIRIFHDGPLPIRRARGYAPRPITLPAGGPSVLAVGGELKATFCLTNQRHALLSQHMGDMANLETLQAFGRTVAHFEHLFRTRSDVIACDLHPGYLSTRWAEEHAGERPVVAVQHHHAHVAALMAEHGVGVDEEVIGVVFDGTGYGTDGAIWGGEVLVAGYGAFARAAHLRYVPLPGGDAAIKRPYRLALAHLWAAGLPWDPALPPVAACPPVEQAVLRHQFETHLNAQPTSSMGRLFDAVAALAGLRQTISYEAQAAIELEAAGQRDDQIDDQSDDQNAAYRFAVLPGSPIVFDAGPVIAGVVDDVLAGTAPGAIAGRFHRAVADLIVTLCGRIRAEQMLNKVALTGGVFQNITLLTLAVAGLRAAGFDVLVHRQVPPNDGGLALGQAAIAQAQWQQSWQQSTQP